MSQESLKTVEDCLLNFDRTAMQTAVDNALNAGLTPSDIISSIRKGFEEVSRRYDMGEFFLSELIMSGETAKVAFEVLKPHFQKPAGEKSPRVVIGTVEGDVHDIGKNIVSTILLSSGFDVYDMGVDVTSHDFLSKIRETGAQVLGMSALLTTTMLKMGAVIEDLRRDGLRDKVKVIVGGQPISKEFSQQIGADAYVDDAPKILLTLAKFTQGDTNAR